MLVEAVRGGTGGGGGELERGKRPLARSGAT